VTDEVTIRTLLQQLSDAWSKEDADSYAAVFTEDADYIGFDRMHFKGHREIAENPAAL
jgi:uncharacterized protein (TIGR02246 family)